MTAPWNDMEGELLAELERHKARKEAQRKALADMPIGVGSDDEWSPVFNEATGQWGRGSPKPKMDFTGEFPGGLETAKSSMDFTSKFPGGMKTAPSPMDFTTKMSGGFESASSRNDFTSKLPGGLETAPEPVEISVSEPVISRKPVDIEVSEPVIRRDELNQKGRELSKENSALVDSLSLPKVPTNNTKGSVDVQILEPENFKRVGWGDDVKESGVAGGVGAASKTEEVSRAEEEKKTSPGENRPNPNASDRPLGLSAPSGADRLRSAQEEDERKARMERFGKALAQWNQPSQELNNFGITVGGGRPGQQQESPNLFGREGPTEVEKLNQTMGMEKADEMKNPNSPLANAFRGILGPMIPDLDLSTASAEQMTAIAPSLLQRATLISHEEVAKTKLKAEEELARQKADADRERFEEGEKNKAERLRQTQEGANARNKNTVGAMLVNASAMREFGRDKEIGNKVVKFGNSMKTLERAKASLQRAKAMIESGVKPSVVLNAAGAVLPKRVAGVYGSYVEPEAKAVNTELEGAIAPLTHEDFGASASDAESVRGELQAGISGTPEEQREGIKRLEDRINRAEEFVRKSYGADVEAQFKSGTGTMRPRVPEAPSATPTPKSKPPSPNAQWGQHGGVWGWAVEDANGDIDFFED